MVALEKNYSYQSAGVNIQKASTLVDQIKRIAKKTHRPGVIGGIGGFSGLFELPAGYKHPVLVSGTDGVGTKLKLAIAMNRHDTIGIDLVAMCVNDIITSGATPLFFLDYYASGALNLEHSKSIIEGIAVGCQLSDITLLGGETAEMPGMYANQDYDLAGFCLGVVERDQIIDPKRVTPGDALIALSSSGVHSNGYSLIRRIIEDHNISLSQPFEGSTLGDTLLTPTRIYAKTCNELFQTLSVHALAHITGGGLLENIPRVLPPYTNAVLHTDRWTWPSIFQWLQKIGHITDEDMWNTFNLGIGMILCVSADDVEKALTLLAQCGETAWPVGHIIKSVDQSPRVLIESCVSSS